MKHLFLLLILVSTNGFAQQKPIKKATAKKKYYTPPPIIKSPELRQQVPPFPQSFAWQINADTTIAPNVIFREVI